MEQIILQCKKPHKRRLNMHAAEMVQFWLKRKQLDFYLTPLLMIKVSIEQKNHLQKMLHKIL